MLGELTAFLSLPTPVLGTFTVAGIFLFIKGKTLYLYLARSKRYYYLPRYAGNLEGMKDMNWKHFEYLCEEMFKARGWKTKCSSKKGADGGVDVWAERKGEKALIQCKRHKNTTVGVKIVRELYGLMISNKAESGYIVTTSSFTKEAYIFAKGKRISLIDGIQLEKLSQRIHLEKDKKNDLELE